MGKSTKAQLERMYKHIDPWGYKTNPDDAKRKSIILKVLEGHIFDKALDIGCGEGFITTDLPAKEIYGYDISEIATSRLPENVKYMYPIVGQFDLVIATGVLYRQYDYVDIINTINEVANGVILTCNIASWELRIPCVSFFEYEFPYRNYIERLALYDFSPSQDWRQKIKPIL